MPQNLPTPDEILGDEVQTLPSPQDILGIPEKKNSNGLEELEPPLSQDGMPFKSPTEIVSEFSGGGSLFPKGSENVVSEGAALPEVSLEEYFSKNRNIVVPKESALSPVQLKTVQQQQNDIRGVGAAIAKTTPERQDPNIQQALVKLQANPNDDAALYQLGYGNLGKNNTAAQSLFEQAIQINPNNYKAKIGLADISFVNGDFGAALKYRQDANVPPTVTLNGVEYNNPDYQNNLLGIAQAQALTKKNLTEAGTTVDEILKSDPKNVLALQVKADIKRQQGHDIEAKDLTWQAVAAHSENTPAPTLYNLEQKWKREHPEADEDTFIAQWLQLHADVANKIAIGMGGNQGAGEFIANIIDPVGYVMGNIEGVKQGLHHMGEGIAQMNNSSFYTKDHVVGLTKAILGGTEATFATLMTTPHGFVFVQGLHGADMLSNDEAGKYIMAPITTMFPVQDELGQNLEAIGDLAVNLVLLGATHRAINKNMAGAKKIREAAQRLKEGKPISKDDTRLLTEVVAEEANPQTLQKLVDAAEKVPDDATNVSQVLPLIAAKKEATDKITELEKEKTTLDEVYQKQKDEEIAEIENLKEQANTELKSITEKKQDTNGTELRTNDNPDKNTLEGIRQETEKVIQTPKEEKVVEETKSLVENKADSEMSGGKLGENKDMGEGAALQEGEPRNLIGATVVAKKEIIGVGGKKKQFEGQVKIVSEELDSQGNTLYDGRYTDAKGKERSILLRGDDIKSSDLNPKPQDTPTKVVSEEVPKTEVKGSGAVLEKKTWMDFVDYKRRGEIPESFQRKTLPELKTLLNDVQAKFDRKVRMGQKDPALRQNVWDIKELIQAHEKANDFNKPKKEGSGAVLSEGGVSGEKVGAALWKEEVDVNGIKRGKLDLGDKKGFYEYKVKDGNVSARKFGAYSEISNGYPIEWVKDFKSINEAKKFIKNDEILARSVSLSDAIREGYERSKERPTEKGKTQETIPKEKEIQKSKFQIAKEKLSEAKKKANEAYNNLGIDPFETKKRQAQADRDLFDAYLDVAREAINEGAKTLKDFGEQIGEEITKHAEIAWKVANKALKYEEGVKEVEKLSESVEVPPVEPKEPIVEGEAPKEVSGIKKALVSDEIIEGVNLEKVSDKEMMDLGRKIIDTKEVNPEAIVRNIVSTGKGVLAPKEVVALITHKADLDNALRDAYKRKNDIVEKGEERGENLGALQEEINALEGKIHDFDVMAVITANQQSMAFRLRKMMLDKDYNVVTQIEKYKANNDGYIPPEVEARFRELGKELDAVKTKLAEAEEVVRLREEQDAAQNITEDVGRKKKRGEISEEEVIQKVKEGIEAEINDIHSKLSPERKRFADKAIAALERLQEKIRKNTYSDATGMLAIVDAGITTIKRAIKAGVAISDAIELGIKKIRESLAKQGIKDWAKENDFRKDMTEGFEAEKISTTKPKRDSPEIKEDGSIKIPNEMIRGLVERGITEIGELTDAVHAEVLKELPSATKRQVRDAITDYGRTVNPTADVIQSQVNAAKRVGRLLSELEDLQAGKSKAKGKQLFKLTEREKDLKRQINALTKNAGLTPEQISTKAQRERAKKRITELEKRLREKDFAPKPKKVEQTDSELVTLNKEKERLQEGFDKAQYENELKNRTFWQKAEDVALELISGLPRALVASIDFSAIFIQGLRRLATSPVQSVKALGESFKQFASEKRQQDWMNNLKAQEFYPLLEASKLSITETGGKISKREELFISNWVNLIYNGLGKVITFGHEPSYNIWKQVNPYKATGRAFTGYTNSIRVSAFLEGAKYLERKGLSFESNPKDFQKWADYVNTTTGRGSLGKAEQSAGWLSTIFFAPRKMIADLKLFTPYAFVYYARMPKTVRQKAVLDYAQAITTVVAANALLWAARRDEDDSEADQFWNPTSTNFLTHKFGNTAVEITGGMRTNIVFMSRLLSGNYTDQYGFESNLGERYGKQINTRQDLVENFLSNKFSPLISLANKKLDERKGLELEAGEYANIAIPMWLQDVRELYKSNPKKIAAMMNLLAVFGASVRTIDTHTTDSIKHKGKDVELTKQQQEEFSEFYTQKESEYLEKLVNDNLYINATDEKKTELKQLINNAARNDAEKELKKLYPQDFQEIAEEKSARETEEQDLEDLKIRLGITEAPSTNSDNRTQGRTAEPTRKETTPAR